MFDNCNSSDVPVSHASNCLNTYTGRIYTEELHQLTTIANKVTHGEIPDTIITRIRTKTTSQQSTTLIDTGALQGTLYKS